MEHIHVGSGGWSDNTPPYNRLRRYARVFDFVEVNTTFYRTPHPSGLRLWRRLVPEAFIFTVKCSRVVTHEERLQPTERGLESLEEMVEVCHELKAKILILQTPRSMVCTDKHVEDFKNLLNSARLDELTVGLDYGGRYPMDIPFSLQRLMEDRHIIHVVDLLREKPICDHEILYSRLFGVKVSEAELHSLLEQVASSSSREAYIGFHTLKMVEPALHMLKMLRRGMERYL